MIVGGSPDFTRGFILLIYSYRIAISFALSVYGTYYVFRLRNERYTKNTADRLTFAVSTFFLCGVLSKLVRDSIAFAFVMDQRVPQGPQPLDHLYVPSALGNVNRLFQSACCIIIICQW